MKGQRILIVDGHPDPDRARFVHALADRYAEGALAWEHEVRRIDLATTDIPVLRSKKEWSNGQPAPAIVDAQASIAWADHIVFLYPLWLGDVPALLKAFLEQVMRPGFAVDEHGQLGGGLLRGKSATIIVTMGMPAAFYSLWFRAHSLKSLERNILKFVGIGPVHHILFGAVEQSAKKRERWLEDMLVLGSGGG
jgi:putative NADPH-quinone reductase